MSYTNLVEAEQQKKRRPPRPLTTEQRRIQELVGEVERLLAERQAFGETVVARANAQLEERLAAQVAYDQKVLDEQTQEHQVILDTWAENLRTALKENETLQGRMAELEANNAQLVEALAETQILPGNIAALKAENSRLSKEVERLQITAAQLQRRINHLETELSLVDPGPIRGHKKERRRRDD